MSQTIANPLKQGGKYIGEHYLTWYVFPALNTDEVKEVQDAHNLQEWYYPNGYHCRRPVVKTGKNRTVITQTHVWDV